MKILEFGDPESPNVLIQPIDAREVSGIQGEIAEIERRTARSFRFLAVAVEDWNCDLSPWPAPAVFKDAAFAGQANLTLSQIQDVCRKDARYVIGGYSLAGLFALWSAFQTDMFAGVAATSPSVWYPDFIPFAQTHPIHCSAVYLSLGDREPKTRNRAMAAVGDCIYQCKDLIAAQHVACTLEWNSGNHFQDADLRTAKAFAWVLEQLPEAGFTISVPV